MVCKRHSGTLTPLALKPTPIKLKKEPKMVKQMDLCLVRNNGTRYKDSCHCSTDDGIVKIENKDTTYGVTWKNWL